MAKGGVAKGMTSHKGEYTVFEQINLTPLKFACLSADTTTGQDKQRGDCGELIFYLDNCNAIFWVQNLLPWWENKLDG